MPTPHEVRTPATLRSPADVLSSIDVQSEQRLPGTSVWAPLEAGVSISPSANNVIVHCVSSSVVR